LNVLGESLSCIFIFYCLDKKLGIQGEKVSGCPDQIRNFMSYSGNGLLTEMDMISHDNQAGSMQSANYQYQANRYQYDNNSPSYQAPYQ
jgi:hypothetical protein